MTALWTVVIPVKGTAMAKSRLGGATEPRAALALAMALDTVTAALAAQAVAEVIVVTSASARPTFVALGATVVTDTDTGTDVDTGTGTGTSLSAAILAGLAQAAAPAPSARNVAILLGDLPALQPHELDLALALATQHPLSMVPDAAGTGTTLLAAGAGTVHAPAFGEGSAATHVARGYVVLEVAASSGLRTDVDTALDLEALAARASTSLGRHTRAALASAG